MRMVTHTEARVSSRTWRGEYGRTVAGEVTVHHATPKGGLSLAERRKRAFSGAY